jgi:hypothetical protein
MTFDFITTQNRGEAIQNDRFMEPEYETLELKHAIEIEVVLFDNKRCLSVWDRLGNLATSFEKDLEEKLEIIFWDKLTNGCDEMDFIETQSGIACCDRNGTKGVHLGLKILEKFLQDELDNYVHEENN